MTNQSNQPTHRIYAVSKRGRKSYWQNIGAAWPNKDGKGFNLALDYLPLNGAELVIREPLPKDDADADNAPAAEVEGGV